MLATMTSMTQQALTDYYANWGSNSRQRFWSKTRAADTGYETPCWLWRGARSKDGYGVTSFSVRDASRASGWKTIKVQTHAVALFLAREEQVSEGLVIDHLCEVRHCVNPEHLRLIHPVENTRRRKNNSGVSGASYSAINKGYMARVSTNGRLRSRFFASKKYGDAHARELAKAWVQEARQKEER